MFNSIENFLFLIKDKKSYFDTQHKDDRYQKYETDISIKNFGKHHNIAVPKDEENDKKISYHITKNFDKNKKTLVYCHTKRNFTEKEIKVFEKEYNIVFFDYLGYADNFDDHNERKFSINDISEQLKIIVEDLEKKLKTTEYYGGNYKRAEQLVLAGRSSGTIPATKVAAEFETEGKKCAGLINIAPPINAWVITKSFFIRSLQSIGITFKNLGHDLKYGFTKINVGTKYESSPAKGQVIISVGTLTAITLFGLLMAYFIYSVMQVVQSKNNIKKLQITKLTLLGVLISMPFIAYTILYFDGKESGITIEDAKSLKETPVTILAPKNDWHNTTNNLKKHFDPLQDNINIYKILQSEYLTEEELANAENKDKQIIQRYNKRTGITELVINKPEMIEDERKRKDNEKFNEKLRNTMHSHTAFGLQNCAYEAIKEESNCARI